MNDGSSRMRVVFVFSLLASLISCNRGEPDFANFVCSNKLIFVEDRDGKGGLYSFSFGDIVALDIVALEKVALTEDRFFDVTPTIPENGRIVFFESKRSAKKYSLGLSAPSAIYSLEFSKNLIQEFRFESQGEFSSYLSHFNGTCRSPAVSSDGKMIAFLVNGKLATDVVVICELSSLRIRNILDGLYDVRDLIWSRDGLHILFSFSTGKDINDHSRGIKVLNAEDLSTLVELKREGWFMQVGDMKDREIVYNAFDLALSHGPEFLYTYKVAEPREDTVFSSEQMSISYPVFGDKNNIYFVAVADRTGSQETDIYELILLTGELRKLTSDGNQKAFLRFVPQNKN